MLDVLADNGIFPFDLDQQAWLDCNSASLLKQEYTGRYVVELANIILILSKSVFVIPP